MSERVVRLGGEAGRVGIFTPGGRAGVPSLLFLNAGWLHHVGPNGLYVSLARRFAEQGSTSLRLDFSGIGDSPLRTDDLPLREAFVAEGREAIDFLEEEGGPGPLVVGGLCSGADVAYRIALTDERVRGVFFLDGFPYRTPGWYVRHYVPRLFRIGTWRRLLSGAGEIRRSVDGALASPVTGGRDIPPRDEAEAGIRTLVDAGVRLLFVYTGGMRLFYNHERQFDEVFPGVQGHPGVQVHYLSQVDHIFSFREHQRRLAGVMENWLGRFQATGGMATSA